MFILQYDHEKIIFPLGSDQNPSVEHAEAAIRDFKWPSADALVPRVRHSAIPAAVFRRHLPQNAARFVGESSPAQKLDAAGARTSSQLRAKPVRAEFHRAVEATLLVRAQEDTRPGRCSLEDHFPSVRQQQIQQHKGLTQSGRVLQEPGADGKRRRGAL